MIPASFDYVAPANLDEATSLLRQRRGARVLAGGHDLLTQMKLRRLAPPLLVDLRNIGGLRGITGSRPDGQGGSIGSMVTCAEIAADKALTASATALVEAARSIGDAQVRNACTIGGNLAYADPAADLPAAVLVLEAAIQVTGPDGTRTLDADQFFLGPNMTALENAEIITAIDLPAGNGSGSAYEKVKNPANNYPICGVAARISRSADGTVGTCRVAVTGVSAHPRRLRNVEAELEGRQPTEANISAACVGAADGLAPTTDLFASGEYRAHLTRVLAAKALTRAAERAGHR